MQRYLAEFAPIQVGLTCRQPADQVAGEELGAQVPQELTDLVHQRPTDRIFTCHFLDNQAPGILAGLQGFRQQVLQIEYLDPALLHTRHKLVVLPLGTLQPQHSIEEQIVMVRRCEPLQAQFRPVHNHLAQFTNL